MIRAVRNRKKFPPAAGCSTEPPTTPPIDMEITPGGLLIGVWLIDHLAVAFLSRVTMHNPVRTIGNNERTPKTLKTVFFSPPQAKFFGIWGRLRMLPPIRMPPPLLRADLKQGGAFLGGIALIYRGGRKEEW